MSASRQFLYGDRSVLVMVQDLLTCDVEVVVNSANSDLSHTEGLAQRMLELAGTDLARESAQLIKEYGDFDAGMAVQTGAGQMAYKAVIHAIVPDLDDDEAQARIEQAVSRSMLICETNDWESLAFPPLGALPGGVTEDVSARAMQRAITRHWDARLDSSLLRVVLCLQEHQFQVYCDAFTVAPEDSPLPVAKLKPEADSEPATGYIELDASEVQDDAGIDDWFK